jgi:hypothetical protein
MNKRSQPPNAEPQGSHVLDVPEYKRVKVTDASHPAIEAPQSDADTALMLMMIKEGSASAAANSSSALDLPGSSISPAAAAVVSPAAKSGPSQGKRKGKKDFTNKVDRRGKRAREGWSAPRRDLEGGEDNNEKKERLAKRKCVVLIGFCGTGYSGMQMLVRLPRGNLESPTIRFVY